MLEPVEVTEKKLESYRAIVDSPVLEDIRQLGQSLRGLRVCHISSTPFGGGVSNILFALVPLERDSGMKVDWYTLHGNDEQFFRVTKLIHNALQGDNTLITESDKAFYLNHNQEAVQKFASDSYDVILVHNHHLLPLPHYSTGGSARWVWHNHLDTSAPTPAVWEFLKPLVEEYHGAIFTMSNFVPADLKLTRIEAIAPAIDPLGPRNRELPLPECRDFVRDLGIDPGRPIALHTSRVDTWKNPKGLIKCYYLAKESIPDLQLVIISSLALDDPDTFSTLKILDTEATRDTDIHVYTNMDGFGDPEVNAFQRASNVGLLSSLREGFGLSVSEMLWKKRPVLGNQVGGIVLQLAGKLSYCLTSSVEESARKMVRLITDDEYNRELGELGYEHVRQHFLMPRLVRDEMAFLKSITGQPARPASVPDHKS